MTKRILAVLMVFGLQMFFTQSAIADNRNRKEEKTKSYKWVYFTAAPMYYLAVHIPLHEAGHTLAAGMNPNYEVSNFKPWPHFNMEGRFYIGSVDISCDSKKACGDKAGLGFILLAPYMSDLEIFAVSNWLLSSERINPTSVGGRVLYFVGMVVPWWDFSYNAIWAVNGSDAEGVATNFEIPRWSVVATGATISALGVWRLWNGYKRAFHGHKEKEPNLIIAPITSPQTMGISVGARF